MRGVAQEPEQLLARYRLFRDRIRDDRAGARGHDGRDLHMPAAARARERTRERDRESALTSSLS